MNHTRLTKSPAMYRPTPTPPRIGAVSVTRSLAMVCLTAALSFTGTAQADNRNMLPRNELALYTQECAACHLGYPPGFLPATSWHRMMGGLDKHYGTDASLDAAAVKQISAWLAAHAGTYKRVKEAPPEDRITRSAWFERKHRQIDPQVWKQVAVKSAANCAACHTQAAKGNFDDDSVSFPKGLDERFRAGWSEDDDHGRRWTYSVRGLFPNSPRKTPAHTQE